jgi:acetyl-CoA carboxylase biotin carboxyl carrier protein
MTPDEITELQQLIEFLKENDIGEFDYERGDTKVRIKFGSSAPATVASPGDLARLGQLLAPGHAPVAPGAAHGIHAVATGGSGVDAADDDKSLHIVKSPIVGTFYESSSPGAAAFIKIGDVVENGQVLCIVEAMKLMNEIESDGAGEVVKRLVTNGQPVEYGQPLFALRLH